MEIDRKDNTNSLKDFIRPGSLITIKKNVPAKTIYVNNSIMDRNNVKNSVIEQPKKI